MLVIALIAVVGTLCWLIFNFAVYALPTFVGLSVGMFAHGTGAGSLGAVVVGFAAAVVTLVFGQHLFATARSRTARIALGLAFAGPAAFAGYHAVFGISGIGDMSEPWRLVVSGAGALLIAATAWTKMSAFAPDSPGQGSSGLWKPTSPQPRDRR